jgi:hypothetical protein
MAGLQSYLTFRWLGCGLAPKRLTHLFGLMAVMFLSLVSLNAHSDTYPPTRQYKITYDITPTLYPSFEAAAQAAWNAYKFPPYYYTDTVKLDWFTTSGNGCQSKAEPVDPNAIVIWVDINTSTMQSWDEYGIHYNSQGCMSIFNAVYIQKVCLYGGNLGNAQEGNGFQCFNAPPCTPPATRDPVSGACDQETYTLSLTPESATIEPGKTYSFKATVTKQGGGAPSKSVPVSVKVEVDPTSGGHDHGETYAKRDKGTVSPATGTNSFSITFGSTEVSGTHTITATCDLCSNSPKTATVNVKVEGLSPIPGSVYYALTESDGKGGVRNIGDNGNHSGNHYLTSAASMKLWKLAADYYNFQIRKGVAKPTLLHLNDASLKWGGKFDITGKWTGEHYEHDRGVVIDIRANTINEGAGSVPGSSIPESMFVDFQDMAANNEANAELHCSADRDPAIDNCVGDLNRHYHVILE